MPTTGVHVAPTGLLHLDDMHDNYEVPAPSPRTPATIDDNGVDLRFLSRSPHPYHRQRSELLEPSDILAYKAAVAVARNSTDATSLFAKGSTPVSDSGTEADDEHVLKRLPAPKARLHKGLRGQNEPLSGSSTPVLSPATVEEQCRLVPTAITRNKRHSKKRSGAEATRRRKELVRRSVEVLLLGCLGALVRENHHVRAYVALYQRGMRPIIWLIQRRTNTPERAHRQLSSVPFPPRGLSSTADHMGVLLWKAFSNNTDIGPSEFRPGAHSIPSSPADTSLSARGGERAGRHSAQPDTKPQYIAGTSNPDTWGPRRSKPSTLVHYMCTAVYSRP